MIKKTIAAFLIWFFTFLNTCVNAENIKPAWMPDIAGDITFETKYIWRGQNMVDDPVIQPSASVSKFGFTASYWGNFSTAGSQRRWTEHDYTIDYTLSLDPLKFSFGHIFYIYPEYSDKNFHSEEFYWVLHMIL